MSVPRLRTLTVTDSKERVHNTFTKSDFKFCVVIHNGRLWGVSWVGDYAKAKRIADAFCEDNSITGFYVTGVSKRGVEILDVVEIA